MKKFKLLLVAIGILLQVSIAKAISIPTLSSPSSGSTGQALSVTCYWNGVSGAYTYTIQLSTDVNFGTFYTMTSTSIYGTSKTYTGLSKGTKYYWRVVAYNSIGTSSGYSSYYTFTTGVMPAFTISLSKSTICSGDSIYLSLTNVAGNDQYATYYWSLTGGTPAYSTKSYLWVKYKSSGTYSISLSMQNNVGNTSDGTSVKVNATPSPSISVYGNVKKCVNDIVVLTANPSGSSYYWSTGETTQSIQVTSIGKYTVNVSSNSCSASSSVSLTYDTSLITLTSSGPSMPCPGDSIKLDAGSTNSNFLWSTGQKSSAIYIKQSGTYSVNALSSKKCVVFGSYTYTFPYDGFKISVQGIDKGLHCTLDKIILSVPAFSGVNNVRWSTGDTGLNTSIPSAGTYSVTARGPNGCLLTDKIIVTYTDRNCLSGIYTIGGSSPDYSNFTAATTAIKNTFISGPVTFRVRNGAYTEQLIIDSAKGVNSKNTITFESENGDSSKVILQAYGNNDYTVKLNYISYVKLQKISIGTGSTGCVYFGPKAGRNSINHCAILGDSSRTSYCCNMLSGYNTIMNNFVKNGGYGIYFEPDYFNKNIDSNTIGYNTVLKCGYGINVEGQSYKNTSGTKIYNNIVSSTRPITTQGISLSYSNDVYIKNNVVDITNGSSGSIGLYVVLCTLPDKHLAQIVNNKIASSDRGIFTDNCNYLNIYHNNFSAPYALYANNGQTIRLKNNIIVGTPNVYYPKNYYSVYSPSGNFSEIGNNVYYPLKNGSGNYTSNLSQIYNKDSNSVSFDPKFTSIDILDPNIYLVDSTAKYLSLVPTDINGNPRNKVKTDAGADEIWPTHDMSIDKIIVDSTKCGYITNEALKFRALNLSRYYPEKMASSPTFTIGMKLDNGTSVTLNPNLSSPANFTQDSQIIFNYAGNLSFGYYGKHTLKVWVNVKKDINHANDTVKISFTNKEKPVSNFYVTNPCRDYYTHFINTSTYNSGTPHYLWRFSNGATDSYINPDKLFSSTGNYTATLTVISPQGCKDSSTKPFIVSDMPKATISRYVHKLIALPSGANYQWYKNGSLISGATTRFYEADENAKYKVVIDNGGCIDTSAELDFIYEGIANPSNKVVSVKVYPNPSIGIIDLDMTINTLGQYILEIRDASGKLVYSEDIGNISGQIHRTLDLTAKAKGIYFLNIKGQSGISARQIISIQ